MWWSVLNVFYLLWTNQLSGYETMYIGYVFNNAQCIAYTILWKWTHRHISFNIRIQWVFNKHTNLTISMFLVAFYTKMYKTILHILVTYISLLHMTYVIVYYISILHILVFTQILEYEIRFIKLNSHFSKLQPVLKCIMEIPESNGVFKFYVKR